MTATRRTAVALAVACLSPSVCLAIDALFVDVSAAWGIGAHFPQAGHGTGAAAADFDGDGLVDLFVPQASGTPDRLYHNQGTSFLEIGAAVGLASLESSRVGLWIDYDADGDLDLWVANDDVLAASSFTLYRQDPGPLFTDVTVQAGVFKPPIILQDPHHWAGLCAGDVDRDGYLDVFTAQWPGPGHLFLNTGAGGFTDVSDASGVAVVRNAHQCAMEDFDGDGWTDIYVAIDFAANILWHNQGDGTFVDVAPAAGLDNAMNDMGVALGDFDGDDDFDVYVTNIFLPDHPDGPRHNVLLRNDSTGGVLDFAEISEAMGVEQGHWGWGASFLDGDNDGDLDLAATNGWRSGPEANDPSRFFESPGGGLPFGDVSTAVQFDDTDWGSSLLAADFDRDGDLDLVQACMTLEGAVPLRLLANERPLGDGNYLVVRPRSSGPNHFSVGALVRAGVGGATMLRRIAAGTSYMGQEPHEAFFGVGAATTVDWVRVDWPDGTSTTLHDVAANQEITVELLFADGFESGDTSRWSVTVD
jgi:hypothetical protein